MKILFLIDCLSSGGKERRLTELMKALRLNKEIEFELITMSEDIHFKEMLILVVCLREDLIGDKINFKENMLYN